MSVSVGDFSLVSFKRQRREMADGKTKGKEKRNDEGHFPHSREEGKKLRPLSGDLFRDLFPE